jgi:5-methylcytosine-specific restriction endonuclease McrA
MSTLHTLVLTPWMAPFRVVSWKEAVSKLYEGKYEVIAEYAETVSSPSVTMNVPAVVRSKKATPRMKRAVKFSRLNVYARDNFTCQYCGAQKPTDKLNYDHVVPRKRGGPTTWENVVCSCYTCNTKKGARTPAEAGMVLRKLPVKPKTLPITPVRMLIRKVPAEWEPFCATAVG